MLLGAKRRHDERMFAKIDKVIELVSLLIKVDYSPQFCFLLNFNTFVQYKYINNFFLKGIENEKLDFDGCILF